MTSFLRIKFITRAACYRLAAVAVIFAILCIWSYFTMLKMPGKTYSGPLPPLTDEQLTLRDELRRDIETLGKRPLPVYFNSGCCLYKSGITTIEIEGDRIELVKWTQSTSPKREWTVPGRLSDFINELQ